MRKLNWREIVSVKGVYGTISDENRAINASGLVYNAEKGIGIQRNWEYLQSIPYRFCLEVIILTYRKQSFYGKRIVRV
jgi:hypothetical protein